MAKYSLMKPDEQAKFARGIANKLLLAMRGGLYTDEETVTMVAQLVRTIGSSELVDAISDAKGDNGYQIIRGGLRNYLIGDYSGVDEDNILNAFGYADDDVWGASSQELQAQSAGVDKDKSSFKLFGNQAGTPQKLPSWAGDYDLKRKWEDEGDIPDFYKQDTPEDLGSRKDMGYTPSREGLTMKEMREDLARQEGFPDPDAPVAPDAPITPVPVQPATPKDKRSELKKTQDTIEQGRLEQIAKTEAEQAAQLERLKQRRAQLKSGYQGGVEQYDYDRAILKGTRLGDTDSQGKFQPRSPEQVEARQREGQYILSEPMRRFHREGMQAATGARQFAKDIDSGAVERASQQIQSFSEDLPDTHPLKNAPPEEFARYLQENDAESALGPHTGSLRKTMQIWSQSKADRELATQNALRQSMIGPRPAGPNRKAITSPDMRNTQLQKIPGVKDPKTGLDVVEDPAARDQRQWAEGRGNRRIDKSRKGVPLHIRDYSVKELRDDSGNVVGYGTTGRRVNKDEVGAASPDLADYLDKDEKRAKLNEAMGIDDAGKEFKDWRAKRTAEEDRKKALQAEYQKNIK